jgi:hypothetical protein
MLKSCSSKDGILKTVFKIGFHLFVAMKIKLSGKSLKVVQAKMESLNRYSNMDSI